MSDDDNRVRPVSALLASAANAGLVLVLFVGLLQLPGRQPERLVGFGVMGWLIYLFPPLNVLGAALALFGASRARLRRFAWGAVAGGTAYAAYLALALFVFY